MRLYMYIFIYFLLISCRKPQKFYVMRPIELDYDEIQKLDPMINPEDSFEYQINFGDTTIYFNYDAETKELKTKTWSFRISSSDSLEDFLFNKHSGIVTIECFNEKESSIFALWNYNNNRLFLCRTNYNYNYTTVYIECCFPV